MLLIYTLAYLGVFATSFYIINLFVYYKTKKIPQNSAKFKVSIIIPAYNEEKGIQETIKSALSLDYPKNKLEIIVIDYGSKDKTYKLAKQFASKSHPKIKVITKKNGGKGTALNKGIRCATGEIIVSMDADTIVSPMALQKMVGFFENPEVMSVAPGMGVYQPRTIWQRIQQIEYLMGVFLRKSFASMNAIHITPGAFSAYRKSFFDKYGGYDEGNITEDLEIALRIQSKNFIIENAPEASVYTHSPETFRKLLVQRRRWYTGLTKNFWDYRSLFGLKKGSLGIVVLPTAVTTIVLGVAATIYSTLRFLLEVRKDLSSLNAINFQFADRLEVNKYALQTFIMQMATSKIFLLTILFILLLALYMKFARNRMLYKDNIRINFILFITFFSVLFAFWWISSAIYMLFNRKVVWREEK